MGKSEDRATKEEVEQLSEMLRKMGERRQQECRGATEFKPGELTPEEEKFVKQEGLNALNYIPQRTLRQQAENFSRYRKERARFDLPQTYRSN